MTRSSAARPEHDLLVELQGGAVRLPQQVGSQGLRPQRSA